MSEKNYLIIDGYCPICEKPARFIAKGSWYRGTLICGSCINGSSPRERAIAHVINREYPEWRNLTIHESSPMNRGIAIKLKTECEKYIGSHFYQDKEPGIIVDGWRNENLEKQTFESGIFDVVISLDVTEHVFDPQKMFQEIYRTLKNGGAYISTFPIQKNLVEPVRQLAKIDADGRVEHFRKPPQYHGNPIDNKGSLVTYDFGYDIHKLISEWTMFDVEISRFSDRHLGILGEYTEVIVCRKR